MKCSRWLSCICIVLSIVALFGCAPESEDGFKDDYQVVSVSPSMIAAGLNFPWGIHFINNPDASGTGTGSVLANGNLLVANRGTTGNWANTVTQIDPHNGSVQLYTDDSHKDKNGESAVDGPFDVDFGGPFVWISNDVEGLGSVAVTDPNPSVPPNGPTGSPGDPVDGPTGTGIFGSNDFGFIVISVYPEDDAEKVPQSTKIEVVFSQPVNPASITIDTFKVTVDFSDMSPDPPDPTGVFLFSDDYTRVEFDYDNYLAESTRYKIFLDKDVTDYRGMNLDGNLASPGSDDFESLFTTGSGNPRVVRISPADGASDVPLDAVIEAGFSEPIRESSVTSTSFAVLDSEGDKIDGVVTVHEEATRARFVPDEPLTLNSEYTVKISSKVEDLAGNPLDQNPGGYPDPFESHFNTGASDSIPPKVASIDPANNEQGVPVSTEIEVIFTESIDPASRTGNYFILSNGSGTITGQITWPSDANLVFQPSNDLEEDYQYTVTIGDNLTDTSGNRLDGNNDGLAGGQFTSSFSTGSEGLFVTSSYPEDGSSSISTGTYIYVNFSKPVNPATVNSNTFFIRNEANPELPISAVVTVNAGNTSASLNPMANLAEDNVYIFVVTTSVTDTAGNPLDQIAGPPLDAFSARFSTGGVDLIPPCLMSIVPSSGSSNVPIGTSIVANFNESVLPGSITSTTFNLNGPTGAVSGTYTFSNGNATVSFNPETELQSSVTYTISITSGVTDSSGNGLDSDCDGTTGPDYSSNFTTGTGSLVINEVVVDPQQDWNDSEGGDGIPFNSTVGSGSITTSDEWIEIYNSSGQTLDLNGYIIEMADTSPETHVIGSGSGDEVLYPPTSTITNFLPGSYLIIGNPVGSNNNACLIVLKNSSGTVVDSVEIGDDPEGDGEGDGAPDPGDDGNADSISNESIARVPNGIDTNNDINDFVKQAATLGQTNSGAFGSGAASGYFKSDPGLVGMGGITYAGMAPDEPTSESQVYFVAHTHRGTVYGIDLDDGAYYAYVGMKSPMGITFIPEYLDDGSIRTGYGLLFVGDVALGNIARFKMIPSGPVGNPNTVMIPSNQGKDAVLFLTFPYLSDPVGIAYSRELNKVFAACRGNGMVIEFDPDGSLSTVYDTGFGVDSLGGITVGDWGTGDVLFLTHTGGERVSRSDGPAGAVYYFDPQP